MKNAPNEEVGPCIHSQGLDEQKLLRELPDKTSFDYPERLHINCTGSYFFVDQPLRMADTVVYFDDRYGTYNINDVVNVIEVVEPAVVREVSIPVPSSNP